MKATIEFKGNSSSHSLYYLGFALFLVFWSPFYLQADDTPVSILGRAENIFYAQSDPRIENLSISMVEEVVSIFLSSQTFSVDAQFTFFNNGPVATLSVGFPKIGYGLMGAYKSLDEYSSFKTWVNQKETPFAEFG